MPTCSTSYGGRPRCARVLVQRNLIFHLEINENSRIYATRLRGVNMCLLSLAPFLPHASFRGPGRSTGVLDRSPASVYSLR